MAKDRRRKLLVNVGEEAVSGLLSTAITRHMAAVHAKVGLKDALQIDRSGLSNEHYKYALMAHLDFVVTDQNGKVAFAVEFDEAHHEKDATAIKNDRKKDRICEQLGLPILRIAEYSLRHVEELEILAWLVDRYFLRESLPPAFLEAASYFRNLNDQGALREAQNEWPATAVHNFVGLRMQAWTCVQFRNHAFFYASAAFRTFPQFGNIYPHQIATEISQVQLYRLVRSQLATGHIQSEQTLEMMAAEIAKQYHRANALKSRLDI